MKIQFLEVATAGVVVVSAPERCGRCGSVIRIGDCFASSKEAHGFWPSLGSERFDHPDGEQFHRPPFIQQRLWPAPRIRRLL